jgi:hypothetical protein
MSAGASKGRYGLLRVLACALLGHQRRALPLRVVTLGPGEAEAVFWRYADRAYFCARCGARLTG